MEINNKNTEEESKHKFTLDDIYACWNQHYKEYFVDILNKEYLLEDAIDDLKSLIGTKWDNRIT